MGLDERFEMKMAKRRGEECGGNRLFKFVQGEGRGTGRVSRGLARWKFNGSGSIFAWMPIDAAICETLLKKVGRGGEGRGRVESRGGCDWSMGEEIRVVPFSSLGRKDCAKFLLLSLFWPRYAKCFTRNRATNFKVPLPVWNIQESFFLR